MLYAPDYVVNAGGVMNIAEELGAGGYDHERAWAKIAGIRETVRKIFTLADEQQLTPAAAADHLAEADSPPRQPSAGRRGSGEAAEPERSAGQPS